MEMKFNGIVAESKRIKYAVKQNNKSNIIIFKLAKVQDSITLNPANHFYVKVSTCMNNKYLDKYADSIVTSDTNYIYVAWTMKRKDTQYKNIDVQVQYEDTTNDIVWQTEIINIDLFATIPADKGIEDLYPSILTYLQTQLDNHNTRITALENSPRATWGAITGTISDQTDLQNALDAKASQTDLAEIEEDLEAETTAREEADSDLEDAIDAEALARTNAINAEASARGIAITAETNARISADNLLSARIDNVQSRGRYLSGWKCDTGLPVTNPETTPYLYRAGDYFTVVSVDYVSQYEEYDESATYVVGDKCKVGTTYYVCNAQTTGAFDASKWTVKPLANIKNYRPTGTQYTATASMVEETGQVSAGDNYEYDGNGNWILQFNTVKIISISNVSGLQDALDACAKLDSENIFTGSTNRFGQIIKLFYAGNNLGFEVRGDGKLSIKHFSNNKGIIIGGSGIEPNATTSNDIGTNTNLWKDLYLSGALKDGTNSVTIANIADKSANNTYSGSNTFNYYSYFNQTTYFGGHAFIDPSSSEKVMKFKVWDTNGHSGWHALYFYNYQSGAEFYPYNNDIDLGTEDNKWRNFYIAGFISDGTNSLAVADISKKQFYTLDTTTTSISMAMESNGEYAFTQPITQITVSQLTAQTGDNNPQWTLSFIAGSNLGTPTLPTGTTWVDGTPEFNAGNEYTIVIRKGITANTYKAYLIEA